MASIGGTSCTFVRGVLPPLRVESHVWRAPGYNGYGIKLLGYGDAAGQVLAVFFSNDAGIDTWAAALHALQGTMVTVINDHGDSAGNVFLARVSVPVKSAARIPGSAVTTRGEIQIQAVTTQ